MKNFGVKLAINKNADDYDEKSMKTNQLPDDQLRLNKTIEILIQ